MSITINDILNQADKQFDENTNVYVIKEYFAKHGMHIKYGTYDKIVMIYHSTGNIIVDVADHFHILARIAPDTQIDAHSIKYCLSHLDEYDVYEAVNGTMITLHYCERLDRWLMTSSTAYDISNMKWMGQLTWRNALLSVLQVDYKQFYDALDKSAQYSFIFRHHDFHPLMADPEGIWQISGPTINGFTIRKQVPIPHTDNINKDTMKNVCLNALSDFMKKEKVHYGFLLRKRVSETASTSGPVSVFIESTLHRFMRDHIYDACKVQNLTPATRMLYCHIRAYLHPTMHDSHLAIFQQARKVYEQLDFVITYAVNATIRAMRGSKIERKYDECNHLFGQSATDVLDHITNMANTISKSLRGYFSVNDQCTHANMRDIYMNTKNINHYLTILTL